jgi:hypothetical protein
MDSWAVRQHKQHPQTLRQLRLRLLMLLQTAVWLCQVQMQLTQKDSSIKMKTSQHPQQALPVRQQQQQHMRQHWTAGRQLQRAHPQMPQRQLLLPSPPSPWVQ